MPFTLELGQQFPSILGYHKDWVLVFQIQGHSSFCCSVTLSQVLTCPVSSTISSSGS